MLSTGQAFGELIENQRQNKRFNRPIVLGWQIFPTFEWSTTAK